jgi:hypothetical protein
MKRLFIAAALLAVAACGRPGDEDEYEETVYDAKNPPVRVDSSALDRRASALRQDSLNLRLDSIRLDSLRRDSLRRDSIRRDTMP